MNISEYMKKHGLTDSMLDELAAPYENASYEPENGTVFPGSHLDVVGKKRVTVIYDAADTRKVSDIAKAKGVRPSDIYRAALNTYLEHASV